ncbi:HAMP domain-containing protein [Chitinispirillales bacterium ANBcel5]|uniref:HAMP domain-containing protein n=1 Tax=Cellulosispirillum alkaliphilum TaxID=3039283 RepID=UPI002A54EA01|nr:HAMP domain-containing protein [Chitinispirillales bacterium ANBcel5]
MRRFIAFKLFGGFLVIIFLNLFLFIIVDKTQDLTSISNILKYQNEIKNTLLHLRGLHNNQDLIAYSFENVGIHESIDNFRDVNHEIQFKLATLEVCVDSLRFYDSLLMNNYSTSANHSYSKHIKNLAEYNDFYNVLFDSLVSVRNSAQDYTSQRLSYPALMKDIGKKLNTELDSALISIDKLNVFYIGKMENRIKNVSRVTILIFTGMTLFSILFGFLFSRAITNSLRRLKESANSVAKGDFNINPFGYPKDEIGDLATAFFNMAVELRNAQDELVRSKRMAAIGEIVASINHEINNPLMIISGNAQFLELSMEDYPEIMKDRVRAIIFEAERISKVTKKLREIKNPVTKDYTSNGEQMINLDGSV